jgi:hypothetical protein
VFAISDHIVYGWLASRAVQEEITSMLNSENACYHSVQNILPCHFLSTDVFIYETIVVPIFMDVKICVLH